MAAISDFFDGMHGVIFPFGGTVAPNGFLMCDGAEVSRTTYAALFSVIGTAFGDGDGSTTFNVPDLRGRVLAGKDDMGGSAAGRITSTTGIDGKVLGAAGGSQTQTLTVDQIPQHSHSVNDPGHVHGPAAGSQYIMNNSGGGVLTGTGFAGAASTASATTGITIQNAGGGLPHNNVQPTIIVNYIIKT